MEDNQTNNEPITQEAQLPQPSKTQKKQLKKLMKRYKSQNDVYTKQNQRVNNFSKNLLNSIKGKLTDEELKAVESLATVTVEEVKNEAGEITTPASSSFNLRLFAEKARQIIVIKKESRIQAKKRKRSTGSRSQRKHHKGELAFVLKQVGLPDLLNGKK